MSLFRKPKKTLRNRGPVEPEEDDDQDNSIEEIHSNISKLKQKKKDKKKNKDKPKDEKKSLLSFDDDIEEEETEEFKIKKSKESRRLIKQKEKEKKDDFKERVNSNRSRKSSPDVEIYHPKNGRSTNNHDNNVKIIDDDIEIVLKDTVPKRPVDTWVISGKEAEALHLEEEDFSEEEEVESDEEDPLKKIIQSGGIPDAAAIHAARKKREAARAAGGKEDFIPIKEVEKEGKAKRGPRLLREEDEDDEEERICFTVKENKREDEYHKRIGRGCQDGVDSDSDPEWEKMQISKAINNQQIIAASKDAALNADLGMPRAPLPPSISGDTSRPAQGSKKGEAPLTRPQKYDLPGIRERMKSKLVGMKEVHRRHEMDADRAVDDLVESQTEIDSTGDEVPELAVKHKFYQELRGYVTDLTDCYDEKAGTITYLEGRINKVYSEQRGKLRERRRQDVRDQADVLAAMTATNMALLLDPVQDAVRDYRVAEREGRRIRRRQARQGRGEMRHNDGLSSDEEMPSVDTANLAKVKQDVENQSRMVLEDVVEEFSVISRVMERLQAWRTTDPDSYQSAYVSLCLPKIFSPLIRMQMLFWSPFTSSTGVSEHEWYSTIATYAISQDESFSQFSTDQDRNLLSSCCEKVVMPKLVNIVRSSYDPVSTSQTNKLVGCLSRLVSDFPTLTPRSKQLRELLSVVVEMVKECLDNDVYIPMYTKHQMETPNTPHSLFFQRQFWSAFKLFKNVIAWAGVLSDSIVAELVLDRLLNRYMLLSLRANMDMLDSIDKARQVLVKKKIDSIKIIFCCRLYKSCQNGG
eukprot:TRINITY_DN9429_c0_g1_i2.p1 TRINITY_DN9429_c0_g1~~TRINITY_DN9429_c0_g1_i2.p1  ORF type:complete len:807 (-),score=326.26 TRINITY_DN9429_c0_g1_i2:237-2657(-)